MVRYLMSRIVGMLPSVFLLVFLVVAMVQLIPGNIIDLMLADSPNPSLQTREALIHELGMDRPLVLRYVDYMMGIVRGNFGTSIWTSKPVSELIIQYAPPTIELAIVAIIIVWGVTGPIFHYSDTWQLIINTGTTIVTFLMVFLIQQSQNKDALAVHLKLNELLASHREASNHLVAIEELDEEELRQQIGRAHV